jgi:hypothetical protein
MPPDIFTMAALARIDQRLRDAAQARRAAQVRAGRRHRRQQRLREVNT